MRIIDILLNKFLLISMAVFLNLPVQALDTSEKIIGGSDSDINQHSYVVSLQVNSEHYCGGSLIAPKFVLTAGHCVNSATKIDQLSVVIGSATHNQMEGETHKVKKIILHPNYVEHYIPNHDITIPSHDIAILEIAKDSGFSPVSIIGQDADAYTMTTDKNSLCLGWGKTETSDTASTLKEATLPLVSDDDCRNAYPDSFNRSMICAGFIEGGHGPCYGDSGGPLTIKNIEGNEILVGVVSWGVGCASPKYFGVFGRVSAVSNWIKKIAFGASSQSLYR